MREWSVIRDWSWMGRVRVPLVLPDGHPERCYAKEAGGFTCTRRTGHTGRHAAGLSRGAVAAVWHG